MPKKFSKEYLDNLCSDKKIVLLRDYDDSELNSLTFIDFKCINCSVDTSKRFSYMLKYDAVCKKCSTINQVIKHKNTLLQRYGVENISQIQDVKNKKKETTLKNYGVEHNSQSKEIKNKKVQTCLNNFGVQYPQQSKEIRDKSKETCLMNYGVEHPSQSNEIREKCKQTCLENYGVEYNSQSEEFKNKIKETCLQKFGVEYPQQSEEIREKSKQTCLQKFGVEYSSQCEEIKNKMKETTLQKFGVEYASQCEEIKNKIKETYLKNIGVEHPTQNEEYMEKISKNSYKSKTFIFSSGREIKCQGYEPFALKTLETYIDDDANILTGCKNVPTIWYNDNEGGKHRHYVDIFIPSQNLCIEVKSTWTIQKKKDNVFLKQNAAKELGYNYEIWVYDAKGNRVECFV